mgnify:CR=1 FL=1
MSIGVVAFGALTLAGWVVTGIRMAREPRSTGHGIAPVACLIATWIASTGARAK